MNNIEINKTHCISRSALGDGPAPRVLCISPFFSPLANAEAFCGGKVALQLLKAGVDLTVCDVDYQEHGKFSKDNSALWEPLSKITFSTPPDGNLSKLWSGFLGIRYLSPSWSRWIAATVSKVKSLHNANGFQVVYSRGFPNMAHIAAYWIAETIKRPWVANFNDPWDLEGAHLLPQDRTKRKRNLGSVISDFWLRRVMSSANALTFPCARLRDYHLKLHQASSRTIVIPHIGFKTSPAPPSHFFELVHAGNLGAGESTRRNSTKNLLLGLQEFLNSCPTARSYSRLVLVGSEDKPTVDLANSLGIGEYLVSTGRLSYSESLVRMASATVCLLVEGDMPEGIYLPSKFADYIQALKPVIALSPETGTISDLLPIKGITQVSVNDPQAICSAIARHHDAFVNNQISALAPEKKLVDSYNESTVGLQLCDLFNEMITGSSSDLCKLH
jgi:hypothetical protein